MNYPTSRFGIRLVRSADSGSIEYSTQATEMFVSTDDVSSRRVGDANANGGNAGLAAGLWYTSIYLNALIISALHKLVTCNCSG